MDVQEKKLALFDAHLSHKGLQHLVDAAASLLGNPLFMADMSMGVVFKSSDMGPGTMDYSAEADPDRQLALAKQAADAGYLDYIYHHDEPIIGAFEGQPRYLAARVRDGSHVLGHVVVAESKRPFEDFDEELLPIVCQTIAFELRRVRDDVPSSVDYGPLLLDLVSGNQIDEEITRKRMRSLGHALPATVRLLLFRQMDAAKTISATYLRHQMLKAFRSSLGIVHNDECIHVVDGSLPLAEVEHRMRASAYLGGIAVSTSRSFSDATMLGWAYRQADAALRLSSAKAGMLVPYDDVMAEHLLELASGGDARAASAFVMPELSRLQGFDERDHTDYVKTLAAYLGSGRNIAQAARALRVHKNSMYYRTQRIEELLGIDLGDEKTCFLLQLSLAMQGVGIS